MRNHTRNLPSDTDLFCSLPPSVVVLILDVIHAVFSILCWRRSSKSLLAEILSRLAETEFFEQTHDEFSAALCPYQAQSRRIEKLSRWIAKLKEDMKLSGFQAIWIENRRTRRNEDGAVRGLPTMYKRGAFWKLFGAVQDAAMKCDLLALPVRQRRAQVRAIVAQWLKEAGAIPIDSTKKTEEIKPAKPSLPCRCACASCATCAAKPHVAPRAEELRREPNEDFETELNKFADFFERHLREIGQIDKRLTYAVKRAHHALEIAEQSATDMIVREKTGGQLRLVGGQPK